MSKKFTKTKLAGAIFLGLLTTGCARFKERTQAEGKFDYQKVTLRDSEFDTGDFTRHEMRSAYEIPELTEQQALGGLEGKNVDVRAPGQLMPVLDGVLVDTDSDITQVSFNAFADNENIKDKVWQLILSYLSDKDAQQVVSNKQNLTIETGPVIRQQVYGSMSKNYVVEKGSYQLRLSESRDKRSIALQVDAKSYQLLSDGVEAKQNLNGRNKRSIEIRFVNDLLVYAYQQQVASEERIHDDKPLPIKLGFDDNHQTAWIIDSDFPDTWHKLPRLLNLMGFAAVQDNQNLGYFLVQFQPQTEQYWQNYGLNPIDLPSGEYFVQLGELTGGETSVLWLDADKKPLTDQQVTDLYLSITEKVRSVILEDDKPKPL